MSDPEWACGRCGHVHDADRACQSVRVGHVQSCNCSRATSAMTDNQKQAADLLPEAIRRYYPDVLVEIAGALDAAEARGRAALATEVEGLANPREWAQWLTPAESRWVADRLRTLIDKKTS